MEEGEDIEGGGEDVGQDGDLDKGSGWADPLLESEEQEKGKWAGRLLTYIAERVI